MFYVLRQIPPVDLVSDFAESVPSPPSPSVRGVGVSPEDLLAAGGKRSPSPERDDASPPVKKLKPEESEPAAATA